MKRIWQDDSMMRFLLTAFLLAMPLAGQSPKPPGVKPGKERPFIADMRARAMRGQAKAQFDLGVSYRFGQGVSQSYDEAVKWYRKAAEQGYAKAQFNLGVCYDTGRGVPQNYMEAVKWYRKAAVQGHAKAQFNLGVSYKYGQGVTRDYVESYAWLSLSAAGGETIALKSREEVAAQLSPPDLERARLRERKLSEELQAGKPKQRRTGHPGRKGKSNP
jgi:TPR repeat protein